MTDTLREELDLFCDEALASEQRAELEQKIAGDEELLRERRQLVSLHRLLGEARIETRPDFQAKVMASLGEPSWARREGFAFHAPFAALLAFGVLGLWLLTGLGEIPLTGIASAVVDFFQTTALAGAGMLTSSWLALGLAARKAMDESLMTFAISFVGIISLDLWLWMLLSKPRRSLSPGLNQHSLSSGLNQHSLPAKASETSPTENK